MNHRYIVALLGLFVASHAIHANKLGKKPAKSDKEATANFDQTTSDALSAILLGYVPAAPAASSKATKDKQDDKKGKFSFKMTDKVKTNNAFY